MKRILITGVNSYIGNKFEEWVSQWPNKYSVTKISLRNNEWKTMNWSEYDVILHVAGIAHNSSNSKLEDLYYKVNRDLTVEAAQKAKADGVSQFIYMSSIIVFGTKNGCIDKDTKPSPNNFYGDSKLQAELAIEKLQDKNYSVTIIRPPMVYGKGSQGNYPKLAKIASLTPIFPDYDNKRSMIHIDNLTEMLRLIIDHGKSGYYHPQNTEYINTTELVKVIADIGTHKVLTVRIFNPLINAMIHNQLLNKLFGDLYYSKELSEFNYDYQVRDFVSSIKATER